MTTDTIHLRAEAEKVRAALQLKRQVEVVIAAEEKLVATLKAKHPDYAALLLAAYTRSKLKPSDIHENAVRDRVVGDVAAPPAGPTAGPAAIPPTTPPATAPSGPPASPPDSPKLEKAIKNALAVFEKQVRNLQADVEKATAAAVAFEAEVDKKPVGAVLKGSIISAAESRYEKLAASLKTIEVALRTLSDEPRRVAKPEALARFQTAYISLLAVWGTDKTANTLEGFMAIAVRSHNVRYQSSGRKMVIADRPVATAVAKYFSDFTFYMGHIGEMVSKILDEAEKTLPHATPHAPAPPAPAAPTPSAAAPPAPTPSHAFADVTVSGTLTLPKASAVQVWLQAAGSTEYARDLAGTYLWQPVSGTSYEFKHVPHGVYTLYLLLDGTRHVSPSPVLVDGSVPLVRADVSIT